jgi:hypothetical protein
MLRRVAADLTPDTQAQVLTMGSTEVATLHSSAGPGQRETYSGARQESARRDRLRNPLAAEVDRLRIRALLLRSRIWQQFSQYG